MTLNQYERRDRGFESGMEKNTIPKVFFYSEGIDKNSLSFLTREGAKITETKRGEFEKRVWEFSLWLIHIGIKQGEKVAILLENSPEWVISDLAITSVGGIPVPLYTTLGKEDLVFLLKDSDSKAIIFSRNHKTKIHSIKPLPSSLTHLIEAEDSPLAIEGVSLPPERPEHEKELEKRIGGIKEDDPFTIIYSSGTTGRQKGVILSHKNILSNINGVSGVINIDRNNLYLSYLPLSHVFERMLHHFLVLKGIPIAYSKGFAYVGGDIHFFRPTFMIGVPFFFDRLKDKILDGIRASGAIKRFVLELALRFNKNYVLDRFVLKKLRDRAAPNVRFFISGGAPLSPDTAIFFCSMGIPILEGYGLTETSPVVTVNEFSSNKIGSVGKAIPGVEIKTNEDGEVLVKGPGVMKGYQNMPELTEETVRQGWLYTGDIGSIDGEGFLTITGRKKDLIITSLGKNISPEKVELKIKADEYVKEALVYGDKKPHLVALIAPDMERLETHLKTLGMEYKDRKELLRDKAVHGFFEERIHKRLKDLARFEQIRRFALIEEPSPQEGELTPTMKVKREKVAKRYKDLIVGLYNE